MNDTQRRDMGLLYRTDASLAEDLNHARRILQKLNTMDRTDIDGINRLAKELMVCRGDLLMNPPFTCDFGYHIEVGDNCLFNYNCTIIDVGRVKLGNFCLLGPNVSIYTAGHPIHPAVRNGNYTYGADVEIGDNVWLGGNVVVCPGVRIGSNSVIGAGSVVTRDIPAWTVAAGNPCRVIRTITEDDRQYSFRDKPLDAEIAQEIERRIAEANDPRRYPVKESDEHDL
jgi:acetyltransferase-like isoleucine patch superfamily enzyme